MTENADLNVLLVGDGNVCPPVAGRCSDELSAAGRGCPGRQVVTLQNMCTELLAMPELLTQDGSGSASPVSRFSADDAGSRSPTARQ